MADVRRRLTLSEQLSSLPPSSPNLADLLKSTPNSDDEVNYGGSNRHPGLTLADVIAGESTASATVSATVSVMSPVAVFQPSPGGRTLLDIIGDEDSVAGGGGRAVSSDAGSGGWRALRDLLRFGASGLRSFRSDNASPIPGGGDVTPATSVDRQEMYLRVSTNAAAAAAATEGEQERMSLMALLEEADRQGSNVRGGLKAALAAAAAEEAAEEKEEDDAAAIAAAERTLNQEALLCCVCMVRKKGAAFIACGHTFCRSCARQLWVSRGTCPLCNSIVIDILDIF